MSRVGLLFLLLVTGWAADPVWTPAHYRLQLDQARLAVEAADDTRMVALAHDIAAASISWPSGPTPGDPTLTALAQKQSWAALRQRLAAITGELAGLEGAPAPAAIDRVALQRLAEREAAAGSGLAAGGTVAGNPLDPHHLPLSIGERLEAAARWCAGKVVDLIDWIRRLFFSDEKDNGEGGSGVVTLTLILVGAVVVIAGVLAVMSWRRREAASPPAALLPVAEKVDADPRSRAADEWARYARELLGLGRHREAIRAWYHAMLVGCWSHGVLHHRVGRTNWEYALALSSALNWRARFQDLTQRFDQAWYGGRVEADESQAYAIEAEQVLGQVRAAGAKAGGG